MQVLIIGGGGREHAIAWKIAQSSAVTRIYVAPGNAGTSSEPKTSNISIAADDIEGLLQFATRKSIDLTVVGPEVPLVMGIVDRFEQLGLRIFGPNAAAAQLEGSKSFTKHFLKKHNIATASYEVFTEVSKAVDYLESLAVPVVIKADGLASGKGVIVAQTRREALSAVHDMLAGNRFGDAGHKVVIEEFLIGEEASFICVVDGTNAIAMASSQDHKARDDGDVGPNTGGMGAYSPAPVVSDVVHKHIMKDIIYPTIAGMSADGNPFKGFLYAGLMIDNNGQAKVIEFNTRLGDPETQPLLMRLESDLFELCNASIDGNLDELKIEWKPDVALGVVMTAGGYPDSHQTGDLISGLETKRDELCKVKIFHAGTNDTDGVVTTQGGRVLCVTALGNSVSEAAGLAYEVVGGINWNNVYYRKDIGYRAMARETEN